LLIPNLLLRARAMLFYTRYSRIWCLIRLTFLQAKNLLLYLTYSPPRPLHLCAMWTLRVAQISVNGLIKHRLKYDVNLFQTYYIHKVGNIRIHVTLRHARVTTVAVEKQQVLHKPDVNECCILRYPASNAQAPYCHLWPVRVYKFFHGISQPVSISGEKAIERKNVFWLSLQFLSETFFIVRWIERDTNKNVYWSSCKVRVILFRV